MKRNEKAIAILSLVIAILVYVCVNCISEIRNQDIHIELIQDELKSSKGDCSYYQEQYKKYYELSEELQNQLGVYYE